MDVQFYNLYFHPLVYFVICNRTVNHVFTARIVASLVLAMQKISHQFSQISDRS